jgi:hypothetical protein
MSARFSAALRFFFRRVLRNHFAGRLQLYAAMWRQSANPGFKVELEKPHIAL